MSGQSMASCSRRGTRVHNCPGFSLANERDNSEELVADGVSQNQYEGSTLTPMRYQWDCSRYRINMFRLATMSSDRERSSSA